jgi:hypothetical protein
MQNELPLDINTRKLRLEANNIVEIKKIFNNMAKDVARIYTANGKINSQELADNYEAEFLKDIRDIMRKTIKQFGFDLRKELELKHNLFFDIETKEASFLLETKKNVSVISNDVKSDLENINQDFLKEATFFVANESEKQAKYITETNASRIAEAVFKEELKYITKKAIGNKDDWKIIAKNLFVNLLGQKDARSTLIASQVVGITESWSRYTEANIIDNANINTNRGGVITANKVWFSILDMKTRQAHVSADQQTKRVKDKFMVDGESLDYPRDVNGSPANTINCRCIAEYVLDDNTGKKAKEDIDLVPTEAMAREAERGLKWRKEFNRGATLVGVARANQLINRERLTPKTIGRMVSYFARHEVDKQAEGFRQGEKGFPSAGRIAWACWGGDAGKSWANRKWQQIKKIDKE